ncbi:MAG: hypothetical protein OEV79_10500 [candidate division WOR-3 bacterium]|nr:hypothetical protein [candidate division WOR-3 bacterium]
MLFLLMFTYTLPIDSPIMADIEYLQLRGFVQMTAIKPYDVDWLIGQIDEVIINETRLNSTDRKIISGFSPLLTKNPGFSYLLHVIGQYESNPELYYGALDERFGGTLFTHLNFSHAMRIRRANTLDTLGPKSWNDFQSYLNEGLVSFTHKKIKLDVGRRDVFWGAGAEHGLLLSSAAQGYDGFLLSVPGQLLEFHGMFSILDAAKSRFLSVHRLGLNLRGFLKVGFSESILSADSLEPSYLNFLLPFYLAQWSSYRDDNIMWALDLQLHLFNSIFYAELLIDDYMYEDDPYPNKLAYQVGLKSLIARSLIAHINYTFVDKWVYTQRQPQNVYEQRGRCLGFPLGNDVDELSLALKYVNAYGIFPHLSIDYIRKGEGSIYIPYEDEGGTINPAFPSGVVEKTLEIKLGIDYKFRRNLHLGMEIGRLQRDNADHITGNDTEDTVFDISLWVIL